MSDLQFAYRIISLCAMVIGWMDSQIIDRPPGASNRFDKDVVQSYISQIRRKLDDIEKEACE